MLQSGFFDEGWYTSTYSGTGPTSPPLEYLRSGFLHGRDAGPLFDTNRYLNDYPDVRNAGVNPLAHFLASHAGEDRRASNRVPPASRGKHNLALKIPRRALPPGRVAVMVHAYYADTFDDVCRRLRSIEFPYALFVSVPDDKAREVVANSLRRHKPNATCEIRVCPNRGRNFGPLLTEFAGELSTFDLLLHLHTKKSLYTGTERSDWRDQLLTALVGSPATVSAVMAAFTDHPETGILYPTTTGTLSYWAHHWLSNRYQGGELLDRLGVREYPKEGYFPYPVGGMFWAKVDAIRPLLDAGLCLDDFPEEMAQTDGTLAHAIERSFVPIVHDRGYEYVEFDATSGAFQLAWSQLNLDQYLSLSLEGLLHCIERAELISFDIFDTVLTRLSVRPDSVIQWAGERVNELYPSTSSFFMRRKAAEARARAQLGPSVDVTMADIYEYFERDEAWTDDAVRAAETAEFECELSVTVARASISRALSHARNSGKRVIAISDTYMSRLQIIRLLEAAGINDGFDELYISSECNARKDRGDLWDLVQSREGMLPEKWLHVGDNEQSDIQAATDRGIATYHCMNPVTLTTLRGLGDMAVVGQKWGNDLLMGPAMACISSDPFPDTGEFRPIDLPRPRDVGYAVFGPAVIWFIKWLATHPGIQSIDHLYFLSREGYLLQKIWEDLRDAGAQGLPPSSYLYTSRRAVMAAAQSLEFNPDQILEGSGFDGTFAELLTSRLGMSLSADQSAVHDLISLPTDEVAVRRCLTELRPEIEDHGRRELAPLRAYLNRMGFPSNTTSGIVDIGYSGTIQKHLQTVLGRGLTGLYMGTVAKAKQVEEKGGIAHGCFVENLAGWDIPVPFILYSLLLEALLTAPTGQTETVRTEDGEIIPVFRADNRHPDELATLLELREGATKYCADVLSAYGPTILKVPVDTDLGLCLVTAFGTGVIRSLRSAAALVVDDDFCGVPRRTARVQQ